MLGLLTEKASSARLDVKIVMGVWTLSTSPRPRNGEVNLVWSLVRRESDITIDSIDDILDRKLWNC